MKFSILVLLFLGYFSNSVFAQNLSALEFKQVKDAPTFIEREKAVIYIRSVIPDIFVNSTNPNYTFRKVNGKQGEWTLRINPSESYMISVGAPDYLSTIPQRFVLKLREVQVWEVIGKAPDAEKIPVNFIVEPNDAVLRIDGEKQTKLTNLQVSVGSREIELSKLGFATFKKTIQVSPQNSLFNFALKEVELQSLTLRSEPQGASVFVDGIEKGQTNKGIFVYPSTYTIKWSLSGYIDVEQTIEVKENAKNEFSVNLEKNSGIISWKVIPNDAQIKLNNEIQTGISVEKAPRTYTISVEKSGFLSQSETVELKRGQTLNRTFTLEKNTGSISWNVTPSNTTILINKEKFTGKTQAELAPGRYLIELMAEGYDSQSETIELKRGETQKKTWSLVQQTGSLRFSVDPVDANVTLKRNSQAVETWTGLKILKNLAVDSYQLSVEMNGYDSKNLVIILQKDKTENVEVKLIKAKSAQTSTISTPITMGKSYTNSIGMEFVLIPAGTFKMGSNESSDEKPIHEVTISQSFYMGKYEVTQKEWKAVMGNNPSNWKGDNLPVEKVSWNDVQEFIKKLNQKEGGNKYRLPTEAEWEYSAKSRTNTKWSFGDNENQLEQYAWYGLNSNSQTNPIGTKKPNTFGLYDMHGNVWEWVQDWFDGSYYNNNSKIDPKGPNSGSRRVLRGGSWNYYAESTRSANRNSRFPESRDYLVGFRLVRLP